MRQLSKICRQPCCLPATTRDGLYPHVVLPPPAYGLLSPINFSEKSRKGADSIRRERALNSTSQCKRMDGTGHRQIGTRCTHGWPSYRKRLRASDAGGSRQRR
jgi:hypothetical protein